MEILLSLDVRLFRLINGTLHNTALDYFFPFITDLNHYIVPGLIALIIGLWKGTPRFRLYIFWTILAVTIADLIGQDLKVLIARPRPYFVLDQRAVGAIRYSSKSFSFPSNHAVNMFCLATMLAYEWRRKIGLVICLYIGAALIAYSRVYVGVHYPSDVLGGAILGVMGAGGFIALDRRAGIMRVENGRIRIGWPGVAGLLIALCAIYRISVIVREIFPLTAEEAQYWTWSRALDWSYYSKPPGIALLIKAFTLVFGNTVIAIRFAAVACSVGTAIVAWRFARDLGASAATATLAVLLIQIIPLFAIGALILTTDSPLLFFWALSCWLFYRAIKSSRAHYWWWLAIAYGLGTLSKYAMIYFIPCAALFFAFTPEARRVLRTKEPWLALVVGHLFYLPIIFWNWRHEWISFRHVAGQTKVGDGFRIDISAFGDFLGGQALVISPLIFVAMAYYCWRAARTWRARESETRLLLSFSVPIVLALLLKSLQGNVEANWTGPAYFTGAVFLALEIARTYRTRKEAGISTTTPVVYTCAAVGLCIVGLAIAHDRTIFESIEKSSAKAGFPIPANADPIYHMIGWDDLGKEVSAARSKMPRPDQTFIVTRTYQIASELAFYADGQPRTYNVNVGRRMNQYDVWGGEEALAGWDAIYVTDETGKKLTKERDRVAELFDSVEDGAPFTITRKKKVYREFTLFVCRGFKGQFPHSTKNETY
ncbi:glycosyltransferase family 39 protein [soil metagenome]